VRSVCAFTDSLEPVRDAVRTWETAGLQHLSVNFGLAEGRANRMRTFASEIGVGRA
jgi:hypothetical protein